MSTIRGSQLSVAEQHRLNAIGAWRALLDDRALRMSCPNSYHDALVRSADELQRLRVISWEECRDLRFEADAAYLLAVAGADFPQDRSAH